MIPQGYQSHKGGYERKDVDVIGVVLVGGLVLLITAISYLTVQGLLLLIRKGSHDRVATVSRAVEGKSRFPQPRLEVHPAADLAAMRRAGELALHSYGWVDRPTGVVHIPIERAMELLLRRGLPEVGEGQTRLQLMQARPVTEIQPGNPVSPPDGQSSPSP